MTDDLEQFIILNIYRAVDIREDLKVRTPKLVDK